MELCTFLGFLPFLLIVFTFFWFFVFYIIFVGFTTPLRSFVLLLRILYFFKILMFSWNFTLSSGILASFFYFLTFSWFLYFVVEIAAFSNFTFSSNCFHFFEIYKSFRILCCFLKFPVFILIDTFFVEFITFYESLHFFLKYFQFIGFFFWFVH